MVLNRKTDRDGLRFLFGAAIIAASIYAFYIGIARINSPELFLVPEVMTAGAYQCTGASSGMLSACIPNDLDSVKRDDSLEVFSARNRIRGTIEVIQKLPQETQWRASLENPLVMAFLGDVRNMDTFDLMDVILRHRYNPTLMGAKAALMPAWMKKDPGARIIYLDGSRGILFFTPRQSLGLSFQEGRVIVVSMMGRIPAGTAAGILAGVRITIPAEQRRGSTGSS